MKIRLDEIKIDTSVQLLERGLAPETVRSYVAALTNDAQMPPIVLFRLDGQLVVADGFHRVAAHRFLGLAEVEAEVREGTRQDALLYAATANVANGKPMSQAEKREAGERLLRMTKWSQHRIARELAVDPASISRWASSIADAIDRPTTVTRNGTTYTMDTSNIGQQESEPEPSPSLTPDVAVSDEAEEPVLSPLPKHMTVEVVCEQCGRSLGKRDVRYPWRFSKVCEECKRESKAEPMAVHFSSATPEHYTPQCIIDATLACLGEIDLDPCSNSLTDPVIPAKGHFTVDDDGLIWKWHGRIYMNPPYGRVIDRWIAKLCEEHEAGRVTEAIALVPARTDTQWWLRLRDFPVCFITGRLTFGGNEDPAPFPSAVFYLGENIGAFYRAFIELGDCWQRMMPGISFGE